jgi:hypothetical protein
LTRRLGLLAIAGAAGVLSLGAPSAEAARGLRLGINDGVYETADAGTRHAWLSRTVDARANLVLLGASWASIAPSNRPPGFDARDPADPAYSWGALDAAVRDATAGGLRVMILVTGAPQWAEGASRPGFRRAPPGTWKPSPGKLADFGHAIAVRYSGSFGTLPRVRYWQLWAEPNLSIYLTPQWVHHRAATPKHYRSMLNAFYGAVKGVSRRDVVITGGTAPYGDPAGGDRMRPVRFWRGVLCLRGEKLRPARCKNPAHFDVIAHNPINVGPPKRHAVNRNDASTPDLGRIERVVRKARHTSRVRPRGPKPFWATEIWWDSKPPDPHGIPERTHARWLEQALYLLWRQGARTAVWFQIRDQARLPDFASTYQTGLFLRSGKPKLAYRAFRFPFVGDRTGRRQVRVWGKAPRKGKVQIQRRRHSHWRTLKRLRAGSNRVFTGSVRVRGKAKLRAKQRPGKSLTWRQKG